MDINLGILYGLLGAIVTGAMFPIAKSTSEEMNTFLLAASAMLIGSVSVVPLSGRIRKPSRLVLLICAAGAVVAPFLFYFGIQFTSASNAALVSNSEEIFTVLMAILIFKEQINRYGVLGIFLIISGILVTTLRFDQIANPFSYGDLILLSAAIFFALDNNLTRIAVRTFRIMDLIHIKYLIGGSVLIIIAILVNVPTKIEWLGLIIIGVGVYAVSPWFVFKSLKEGGSAVLTAVIFSTSNIFALLFSYIILQEDVSYDKLLVAASLILLGIYIYNRTISKLPTNTM